MTTLPNLLLITLIANIIALSGCQQEQAEPTEKVAELPIPKLAEKAPTPATALSLNTSNKLPPKVDLSQLQKAPNFKSFTAGKERKEAFFAFMTPLIVEANKQVMAKRKYLQEVTNYFSINEADQKWLTKQAELYNVSPFDPLSSKDQLALEKNMDIIPASLALAQAANESAWGTSRFARKANNYFGQWCFSKGCGLIPKHRAEGAKHEVRAFEHPYESVASYIHNLNSHATYKTLRNIRFKSRQKNQPISGTALAEGLVNYSARKHEYVEELQKMIRYNKLKRFNHTYN